MEKKSNKSEKEFLLALAQVEDLAEKKSKIYSRLLTDAALAEDMEQLAARHAERKKTLESLAFGSAPKEREEEEE